MVYSSILAIKPGEGGGITFKMTLQDLDPIDILDMPKPGKRQPTPSSPYYLTDKMVYDRYRVVARVKMKKMKSFDS